MQALTDQTALHLDYVDVGGNVNEKNQKITPILKWQQNQAWVELYMENKGFYALVKTSEGIKRVPQEDIKGLPVQFLRDPEKINLFQQHTYVILNPTSSDSYTMQISVRGSGGNAIFLGICAVLIVAMICYTVIYVIDKKSETEIKVAEINRKTETERNKTRELESQNALKASENSRDGAKYAADGLSGRKKNS